MNAKIGAGPFTVCVKAVIVNATVSSQINIPSLAMFMVAWACPSLSIVSINGHSLSAINPDFVEEGELTTLALA